VLEAFCEVNELIDLIDWACELLFLIVVVVPD
jgi:hypothetical protein